MVLIVVMLFLLLTVVYGFVLVGAFRYSVRRASSSARAPSLTPLPHGCQAQDPLVWKSLSLGAAASPRPVE